MIDHISLLSTDPEVLAEVLSVATDAAPPTLNDQGQYCLSTGSVSIYISKGDPFKVSTKEYIAFNLTQMKLQDAVTSLAKRGIQPTMFSLADGLSRCFFHDWDGHMFELIERVPTSLAQE